MSTNRSSATLATVPSTPTTASIPVCSTEQPTGPALTPLPRDRVDLADPIWTIDHVASALHLSVDRAREYTYSPAFPAPRAGFGRNLWARHAVLDWFDGLAAGPASRTGTTARPARARRQFTPRAAR